MPATFLTNNWITFLRQHGPIPRNDNMYDESGASASRIDESVVEFGTAIGKAVKS